MATKHWARDVNLQDPTSYIAGGNHNRANALLYHFLRVAGWGWLWECDGDTGPHSEVPNHIVDGNVRAGGVTNWSAVNAGVPTKDTTVVHSGAQSLKIVASALGDGAISDTLLNMKPNFAATTGTGDGLSGPVNGMMTYTDSSSIFSMELPGATFSMTGSTHPTNNGDFPIVAHLSANSILIYNPVGVSEGYITPNPPTTPGYTTNIYGWYKYELEVWAYNAGDAWDVEVDPGTGVFASVGTLPNNGGAWVRYHFDFEVQGGGGVKVRFVSTGVGAHTIYIGGALCFRSQFEYMASDHHTGYTAGAPNVRGTDGILTNPDRFSTAGSHTCGVHDVGKHLFVWDPTNNKNSGVYEVIADLGGGVVQVDMRSGSAAFVTQSALNWRLISIAYPSSGGMIPNSPMPVWQQTAGFGVESFHSSKWRWFIRQNQSSAQTVKSSEMWSAPEDTDFDFSDGHFYKSGPSVMRNRAQHWTRNVGGGGLNPGMHTWRGLYSYFIGTTVSRTFIMTDEEGAFFLFVHYSTHDDGHGCHLNGYLGSSPQHPGIMSCYQFAPWESVNSYNAIFFDDFYRYFSALGTGYDSDGQSRRACLGQLGYENGLLDVHTMPQQKANPFSGREWVHTPFIGLDPEGVDNMGGEMDADGCGVYQGGTGIVADLSTFDSEQFLHFTNGLVIEWSGETIL